MESRLDLGGLGREDQNTFVCMYKILKGLIKYYVKIFDITASLD